jgi:hypothetical protein
MYIVNIAATNGGMKIRISDRVNNEAKTRLMTIANIEPEIPALMLLSIFITSFSGALYVEKTVNKSIVCTHYFGIYFCCEIIAASLITSAKPISMMSIITVLQCGAKDVEGL